MVIKEAERSFMYLSLYGFNVDAIIVNRLLPAVALGQYFGKWGEIQHTYLQYVKDQFSPVPILTLPLFPEEVLGLVALKKMGDECFSDRAPADFFYLGQPQKFYRLGDKDVFELTLPFVNKGDIALSQKGDELSIKIGEYKRNLYLPRKLQGKSVTKAALNTNILRIEFEKLEAGKA
jgi:arsenite-transporting ATPase